MADFTVKRIADLLGVSKTTIQNALRSLSLECDYIDKNRQYYGWEKASAIIRAVQPGYDLSQLPEAAENRPNAGLQRQANRKPPKQETKRRKANSADRKPATGKPKAKTRKASWRSWFFETDD